MKNPVDLLHAMQNKADVQHWMSRNVGHYRSKGTTAYLKPDGTWRLGKRPPKTEHLALTYDELVMGEVASLRAIKRFLGIVTAECPECNWLAYYGEGGIVPTMCACCEIPLTVEK
jgi:hypothetical protein